MHGQQKYITYPLHQHQLELQSQEDKESIQRLQCGSCEQNASHTSSHYHCKSCEYQICMDCALPLAHPMYPGRKLYNISTKLIHPDWQGRWKCSGCEENQEPGVSYYCFQNQAELCSKCFEGHDLPIHEHPLKPVDVAELYGNLPGWWQCEHCKRHGEIIPSRYSWHCTECEFDYCCQCLKEEKTSLHDHPMRLTDVKKAYPQDKSSSWSCHGCQQQFDESNLLYHCSICKFDVCQSCFNASIDDDEIFDVVAPVHPRRSPISYDRKISNDSDLTDDSDDVSPDEDDINNLCVICCEKRKSATIIHGNTGHVCCCISCAKELRRRGDRCPMCRTEIECIIKHYTS